MNGPGGPGGHHGANHGGPGGVTPNGPTSLMDNRSTSNGPGSGGSSASGGSSGGGGGGPGGVLGGNPNSVPSSALNHHHGLSNHGPSHPHHNLNPRDLYPHQAINGYMPNGYALMSDPSAYSGKKTSIYYNTYIYCSFYLPLTPSHLKKRYP